MRTSMITTSGRRRSARATALAPSDASPMTRMWGARDSDSRRPSRTTSWSSTIRQVISEGVEGVDTRADDIRLDGQRQLLGLGRRGQANLSPVADAVLAHERAHLGTQRISLLGAEVGAPPRVEPLVERQLLGPVLGEVFEEVLPRSGAEEEEIGPDAGRARLPRGPHDLP